jgi:hypothetical protein
MKQDKMVTTNLLFTSMILFCKRVFFFSPQSKLRKSDEITSILSRIKWRTPDF